MILLYVGESVYYQNRKLEVGGTEEVDVLVPLDVVLAGVSLLIESWRGASKVV